MAEFLVCYDYGMGGLWALVEAGAPEKILREYPEVVIFEEPPAWVDEDQMARLRAETITLTPGVHTGIFRAVVADREKGAT